MIPTDLDLPRVARRYNQTPSFELSPKKNEVVVVGLRKILLLSRERVPLLRRVEPPLLPQLRNHPLRFRPEQRRIRCCLRSEVNSELNFPPNFEGLVLGCIDADFCK